MKRENCTFERKFRSALYFHVKRLPLQHKDLHLIQLQWVRNSFQQSLSKRYAFKIGQAMVPFEIYIVGAERLEKPRKVRSWSFWLISRMYDVI